eukprot:1156944-Pelagomonas_calceolata.AAC.1
MADAHQWLCSSVSFTRLWMQLTHGHGQSQKGASLLDTQLLSDMSLFDVQLLRGMILFGMSLFSMQLLPGTVVRSLLTTLPGSAKGLIRSMKHCRSYTNPCKTSEKITLAKKLHALRKGLLASKKASTEIGPCSTLQALQMSPMSHTVKLSMPQGPRR